MAELADAHGSGPCGSNTMRVQVPPPALRKRKPVPEKERAFSFPGGGPADRKGTAQTGKNKIKKHLTFLKKRVK